MLDSLAIPAAARAAPSAAEPVASSPAPKSNVSVVVAPDEIEVAVAAPAVRVPSVLNPAWPTPVASTCMSPTSKSRPAKRPVTTNFVPAASSALKFMICPIVEPFRLARRFESILLSVVPAAFRSMTIYAVASCSLKVMLTPVWEESVVSPEEVSCAPSSLTSAAVSPDSTPKSIWNAILSLVSKMKSVAAAPVSNSFLMVKVFVPLVATWEMFTS